MHTRQAHGHADYFWVLHQSGNARGYLDGDWLSVWCCLVLMSHASQREAADRRAQASIYFQGPRSGQPSGRPQVQPRMPPPETSPDSSSCTTTTTTTARAPTLNTALHAYCYRTQRTSGQP
jgi:hypothetical protein